MSAYLEEGDACPHCQTPLVFEKDGGCSCHIAAPCGSCVASYLCCPKCGFQPDEPEPQGSRESISLSFSALFKQEKPSADLGDGKRLFDWSYDSSSGSTMEYRGSYSGPVTAADIIAYFGDGTFGHRGPTLSNGRFTFTKITD